MDRQVPARPTAMRIDPERCEHGGLCRLLAPDVREDRAIPVNADTLLAMSECPTGALTWYEPETERPCDAHRSERRLQSDPAKRS